MTRFQGTFQGHTTGGGASPVVAGLIAAGVIAALVFKSGRGAAAAIDAAAWIFVTLVAVVAVAIVTAVVVARARRRGRTPAAPPQQAVFWKSNPDAIPVRERPAIAAPVQPVININLGDALGVFLREQSVPVYRVTAEQAGQQQELPR